MRLLLHNHSRPAMKSEVIKVDTDRNTELRNTKCRGCKYFDSCYGIVSYIVRETCTNRVTDGGRGYVREPARWAEMSYYRTFFRKG